ncbi:glycosyltransferase 61 family protein [Hydrogenophaga sp.]
MYPHFIRYRAIHNAGLGMLGRSRTWSQAAADIEVIQPEEVEPLRPAVCLPGQLERATSGVPGLSTLEQEMGWLTTDPVTHAAVIRYTLRDCLVHAHGVEYAGGCVGKSSGGWQRIPSGAIEAVPSAAYCMSAVSHQYFGHWLQDACATSLLARAGEALVLDVRPDWPHATEYADAFELRPHPARNLHVRELSVFQDLSQGSSKRQRYARLRDRLARAFGPGPARAQPVYLRRGSTGVSRVISNEAAVTQRLESEGFLVLDIAGLSATEMFRHLAAAPVVVCMDGSHMNHLYFSLPRGGSILSFIPADRFTVTNFGYAGAAGLHFGMLVVERDENGYVVDVDAMMRTLDLLPH